MEPRTRPEETPEQLRQHIQQLQMRLGDAEGTLQAIRQGEVDALVVSTPLGPQVYTLHSAEHPYRILVEEMQEGALTLTATGLILYANLAVARMLRTPPDHLVGTTVQRFVAPRDRQNFLALLARGVQDKSRGEVLFQAADGTLVPALLACNSLRVIPVQCVCVVVTDLTELQRLEHEAQQAQRFALLGRLAAGMSHELRNPLAAILLHVELCEEELRHPEPDGPAQMAQSLADIKAHLARLEDLVQDYLSLVHVAAIERTPQDLGAAVLAWAAEWQALATSHGITLRLEGLEGLGHVPFHASTLRRALLNLVQNAVEAMPSGGTLAVVGQRTATQVRLRVQDTGCGIPAERLAQLFEPLYTTKPGGTGLGLYIAQAVVTAHEGQVTVESRLGQGTAFTLTLPQGMTAVPASGCG